ncbi:hypothetical protein F3J23_00770 [Chryseobacterium sp. Tr-659]|uniref:hypothetical protein n=1 Tax=Chryseobacterium sp. Tr-659 TaxID=2608340 RepID=UPI0014224C35|nr:hypothetical protein [Chryseobacterium sp. Tr-659]NIF03957.1 hypothetical protein [Chryseobacterium sp. Tr-659]
MKIIIVTSVLLLLLTLFNYPVFDSKNISFSIIFLCFLVIIFSAAKLYFPEDKSYEHIEKETDKLHEHDGIFQYTDNGFYIKQEKSTKLIKWEEIVSVYSFRIPSMFNEYQSGLEIITDTESYEFDNDVTPGIIKLADQLSNHLPSWEIESPTIRINNFGLKKTKLYERITS